MKIPALSYILEAFQSAVVRFPLSMLSAATGTVTFMMLIERTDVDRLPNLLICALLGLSAFTAATIWSEQRGWVGSWRHWAIHGIILAGLALYGWFLPDPDSPGFEELHLVRLFALLAVAHLAVAAAPYLRAGGVGEFWHYNKSLFINIVAGGVYSGVLYIGLSVAIFAVDQLFDLHINPKIYGHLFGTLAGIFNTAYFLFHFPKNFEEAPGEQDYNLLFRTLCKYILIPIVGLYFLILYSYSAKILFTWNLPRGWVSQLVIWFSVAGIFTYLLNYRLPATDKSWLPAAYQRWFWPVLLPMLLLLFVAIGRRISDYGITQNRFLVAHTGVWLLICAAYFVWSKKDNIKFIPISLSIFTLLAVIGPFSAFEVANRNQRTILRHALENNDRFADGKVRPSEVKMDSAAVERTRSSLIYLDERDRLSMLQAWFNQPIDSLPTVQTGFRVAGVMQYLKITEPDTMADFKHVSVSSLSMAGEGEISGFTKFRHLSLYTPQARGNTEQKIWWLEGSSICWEEMSGDTVLVHEVFDLKPYLKECVEGQVNSYYEIPEGKDVVNIAGKHHDLRLFVSSINFAWYEEQFKISSLEGNAFVKPHR